MEIVISNPDPWVKDHKSFDTVSNVSSGRGVWLVGERMANAYMIITNFDNWRKVVARYKLPVIR